jgi:hypothetical protein
MKGAAVLLLACLALGGCGEASRKESFGACQVESFRGIAAADRTSFLVSCMAAKSYDYNMGDAICIQSYSAGFVFPECFLIPHPLRRFKP